MHLVEVEPGHLAEQPAAQRPRAVVLAGDGQRGLGHAVSPSRARSGARPAEIISQRSKKCTSLFALRGSGSAGPGGCDTAGDWECSTQAYQAHSDIMAPVRAFAGHGGPRVRPPGDRHARSRRRAQPDRGLRADRARGPHPRAVRRSASTSVTVGNREVAVREEAAHVTPFGTLLHFKKDIDTAQPRVLLVAPLSGHFATLLRGTVRTMLPEHDVYITDWHNVRDVAASARPLRLRRLCRAPDQVPRGDRPGRACASRCASPASRRWSRPR